MSLRTFTDAASPPFMVCHSARYSDHGRRYAGPEPRAPAPIANAPISNAPIAIAGARTAIACDGTANRSAFIPGSCRTIGLGTDGATADYA
jgi:hypothetical protein